MDAELRSLERKLALDPLDLASGTQLARLVGRTEDRGPSARIPREIVPGSAVLVVRSSKPRPAFAWRPFMDQAIGRVGVVRSLAKDGLTAEVFVPDVGRFHAGAASLFTISDARLGQAFQDDGAPRNEEPEPPTLPDLRRLAERAVEDQGELGADGLTEAQRLIFTGGGACGSSIEEFADGSGFLPENNRTLNQALVALYGLVKQNPGCRYPDLSLEEPNLLPGQVHAGGETSGRWSLRHHTVEAIPESLAGVLGSLPWAVVAGLRDRRFASPPHESTEVADALVKLLENPRAELDDVLTFLPGPDFLGGGEVGDEAAIRELYLTGEGELRLRASLEVELPSRIAISVPFPDPAAEAIAEAIVDEIARGDFAGIARVVRSQPPEPPITIDFDRGTSLMSVKKELERELPLERSVRYRLPMPLLPWLQRFLEHLRGLPNAGGDAGVKRQLIEARSGGVRRTRIF